jgi:hypothetical protein
MRITRIPVPLLLAAAVAVGLTVTLVIQIVVLEPLPAIAFPTVLGPDSTLASYTLTIEVLPGEPVNFATIAGMGQIYLWADAPGLKHATDLFIGTVILKNPGNYSFRLSSGQAVVVKDLNSTYAIVAIDNYNNFIVYGFVTKKVQVGSWYIYHPVVSEPTTEVVETIRQILTELSYRNIFCLFQPTQDYIEVDETADAVYIFCDKVDFYNVYRRGDSVKLDTFSDVSADSNNPNRLVLAEALNDGGYYFLFGYCIPGGPIRRTTSVRVSVRPLG